MWRIPIERRRSADRFVLRAELPGLDAKQDVRVTYDRGELRLNAVREPILHPGAPRSEFHYGTLLRTVRVPAGLLSRTLTARYAAGVLEITGRMGPVEPSGPARQIPVATG